MQIIGFLIVIAIISTVSAIFIRLGAKIVAKQPVGFAKPFWVSFAAFCAAFVVQFVIGPENRSIASALPGLLIFGTSGILGANLIPYGENGEKSYGKAFLVALIQCFGLLVVGLIVTFGILGLIGSRGLTPK